MGLACPKQDVRDLKGLQKLTEVQNQHYFSTSALVQSWVSYFQQAAYSLSLLSYATSDTSHPSESSSWESLSWPDPTSAHWHMEVTAFK